MSWFSDLFGREQETEIADGALALYWDEEAEQYRERLAADSWSTVCNLCGGAGGIECPDQCGGHAGSPTNCTRCGGYGSVVCPVCTCLSCGNEGVVDCPAGCAHDPEGGDPDIVCPLCENQGVIECPMGCVE